MTKRPRNKICSKCGRRSIAPEGGPNWRFPKNKMCFNCTSFLFEVFDQINANLRPLIKTIEQSKAVFPLIVLDTTENKSLGMFGDFRSLRRKLNMYRADYPKSKIKIIDRKYHDFTDYFLSTIPKS
jgi:hypothetical protein